MSNMLIYSKSVKLFIALAVLWIVAGCQYTMPRLSMSSLNIFSSSPSYESLLARGYNMLAEYESILEEDEAKASYFLEKAELAKSGKTVEPGNPGMVELSRNASQDIATGYVQLSQVLSNKSHVENMVALAEAQVNFDCWLMRAADKEDSAHLCRDAFYSALDSVEIRETAPRVYAVYFGSGKATPSQDAMNVIKQAAYAHGLNEDWPVFLTGFTDQNGNAEDNKMLSMRRAYAVRNALAQYGVDPHSIVIEAVGEKTGDVSDAEARRVDIRIEPAYQHKGKGQDVRHLSPHHVNADDGSLM